MVRKKQQNILNIAGSSLQKNTLEKQEADESRYIFMLQVMIGILVMFLPEKLMVV